MKDCVNVEVPDKEWIQMTHCFAVQPSSLCYACDAK